MINTAQALLYVISFQYGFEAIAYPDSYSRFGKLSDLGHRLILVHTNNDNANVDKYSFKGEGTNVVEKTSYKNGLIYINKSQYLTSVEENVYNFTIGGNSPIQKWLKDRKTMALRMEDVDELRTIIYRVEETIKIMNLIDQEVSL